MGTGITIIPYIDPKYTTTNKDKNYTETATANSSSRQSDADFETALNNAKKAVAAVAIDKLVAESKTGSVNTVQIQQFFNQHGIDINLGNLDVTANNSSNSLSGSGQTTATDNSARTHIANEGTLKCPEEYNKYFEEAAAKYNVDVKLLKAVAKAESNFNPKDTSSAGAMGIMQLMPATAKEYNVDDPYDPRQNIMGGAELLSNLLKKYNGDKTLALAAYNAGPGNVAKYGGVPPFKETQTYIKRVLAFYNG